MTVSAKTLTNANSTLRIRCPGVYDNWVNITEFSADNRTTADARTLAEGGMGVDGVLSYGYSANAQTFNVYLRANSPSIDVFRNIMKNFDENMEVATIEFEQNYPSVRRKATFKGTMQSFTGISGGAKLLADETAVFMVDRAVEVAY